MGGWWMDSRLQGRPRWNYVGKGMSSGAGALLVVAGFWILAACLQKVGVCLSACLPATFPSRVVQSSPIAVPKDIPSLAPSASHPSGIQNLPFDLKIHNA